MTFAEIIPRLIRGERFTRSMFPLDGETVWFLGYDHSQLEYTVLRVMDNRGSRNYVVTHHDLVRKDWEAYTG